MTLLSCVHPHPLTMGMQVKSLTAGSRARTPASQPLRSILKIVPSFNVELRSPIAGIYPDRIYVERSADKHPEALDCKLPNDVTVEFSPDGKGATTQYAWTDLRDVVLRIPRQ